MGTVLIIAGIYFIAGVCWSIYNAAIGKTNEKGFETNMVRWPIYLASHIKNKT